MFKNIGNGNAAFNRFIKKNLVKYLIPNVLFNTVLPYLTLRNLNTVYFFEGQYCFARFLLPMALFLPFVITFDILKKFTTIFDLTEHHIIIPDHLKKQSFIFKVAGINGLATLFIIAFVMLCIQLSMPKNYGYNGSMLCVFLGIMAGIMSVVFTLLPIRMLLRLKIETA